MRKQESICPNILITTVSIISVRHLALIGVIYPDQLDQLDQLGPLVQLAKLALLAPLAPLVLLALLVLPVLLVPPERFIKESQLSVKMRFLVKPPRYGY